jgi:hypothetical protein
MGRGKAERLAWDEAIALVGRADIESIKVHSETKRDWRENGIPWERIGPMLRSLHLRQNALPLPSDLARHVHQQIEILRSIPELQAAVTLLTKRVSMLEAQLRDSGLTPTDLTAIAEVDLEAGPALAEAVAAGIGAFRRRPRRRPKSRRGKP